MNFKDIIKKEFLFEEDTSSSKAALKIFYKIDIELIKKMAAPEQPAPEAQTPEVAPQPAPEQVSQDALDSISNMSGDAGGEEVSQDDLDFIKANASVVTEDDKEKVINDDNKVVRKLEGEVAVTKDQVDNIQTVDDLLDILSKEKKDGDVILDGFSLEVIQTLLLDNVAQKLGELIDQKSSIYVDLIYGKKKDDSVGIRMIKRKNNDKISNMLMVDNELINSRFNINTVNDRIVQARNSFFEKK